MGDGRVPGVRGWLVLVRLRILHGPSVGGQGKPLAGRATIMQTMNDMCSLTDHLCTDVRAERIYKMQARTSVRAKRM